MKNLMGKFEHMKKVSKLLDRVSLHENDLSYGKYKENNKTD
jgi:hypothetical protein